MLDLSNKTPEEIQKIINEAQATLVEKQKSQRKEVIAQIKALADSIGVSVVIKEDNKPVSKLSQVAPKYRNPNNHLQTWSGRGLKPKWISALEAEGYTLDNLSV